MKLLSNFLIGIGMFALIFGTSMAEPMDNSAFFFQITCLIGGICVAFIGGIVRTLAE